MELDNAYIAVPIGSGSEDFKGVIKLNETAAFIFKLLQDGATETMIVSSLCSEYRASKDLIVRDVHDYIEAFKQSGILIG